MRFKRLDFDDVEAQIRAALPDGWKIEERPKACTCGGHNNPVRWILAYSVEDRWCLRETVRISIRHTCAHWVARDMTRSWALERFEKRFLNIGDAVEASTRYVGCEHGVGGKS